MKYETVEKKINTKEILWYAKCKSVKRFSFSVFFSCVCSFHMCHNLSVLVQVIKQGGFFFIGLVMKTFGNNIPHQRWRITVLVYFPPFSQKHFNC